MPRAKGSSAAKRPLSQSLTPSPRTDGVFLMFYPVDRDIQTSASSVQEVHQRITEKHYVPTRIRPFENGYFVSFVGLPPHLAATMIEKLDICVQGTWFYPCNPDGPKPLPKKAKPASPQPPAHVLTTAPAEPIAAPVSAIMVPSTTESPPVARSTPPVPSPKMDSDDDFSESEMIESPSDSSFTLPPPSDEESQTMIPAQTTSLSTAIPPVTGPQASHAEVRALSRPRRSPCQPRPRRHPALLRLRTPRDPRLVTILLRPSSDEGNLHKVGFSTLATQLQALKPEPLAHRRISGAGLAIDFPESTPTQPLLAISLFAGVQVKAFLPSIRTPRVGCIRGPYSSAEEVAELYAIHNANPPTKEITRLGKTDVFKIVFASQTIPASVKVLYNTHRVTAYFVRPQRCYKCQRVNHVAKDCRSSITCGKCGRSNHVFKDCVSVIPRCANCGGPHNTADRNCPHWIYEVQVRKLQARENVTFHQARAKAAATYAEALKRPARPQQEHEPACSPVREPAATQTFSLEQVMALFTSALELCFANIGDPASIPAKLVQHVADKMGITLPNPTP